ncbi:MAG: TetR/AcrR family transcriptional regulator [Solirubrobacteraceae bacterium]
MPRTADPARRAELLSAAVDYAVENGIAGLTLRPLAQALGVQPNTLVHHFGGKEQLLSAILNGVRDRLRAMRLEMQDDGQTDPLWGIWSWTASPAREPFFRFFFETYGLALHQPERYAPFLERVVGDWIDPRNPARATLELAVLRGLLLDLLTTGERERVEGALQSFCELTRGTSSGRSVPNAPT